MVYVIIMIYFRFPNQCQIVVPLCVICLFFLTGPSFLEIYFTIDTDQDST